MAKTKIVMGEAKVIRGLPICFVEWKSNRIFGTVEHLVARQQFSIDVIDTLKFTVVSKSTSLS